MRILKRSTANISNEPNTSVINKSTPPSSTPTHNINPIEHWIKNSYSNVDLYSFINIKKRLIKFNGDVDDFEISDIIGYLEKFEEIDDTKPVTLIINSDGGSPYAALKFHDAIRRLKIKVNTLVEGRAYSAASVMAVCATGKRYITPNSYMMFHQLWGWDGGKLDDKKNRIKHDEDIQKRVEAIYMDNSKIKTKTEWKKIMSKDSYYTAQQCIDNGFIDEIV